MTMLKKFSPFIRLGLCALLCLSLMPLTGCSFHKQSLPRNPTRYASSSPSGYPPYVRGYRNGKPVYKANPMPSHPDGSGYSIAATATSQIGKPYVSGGISPRSGFDCSGLVYWSCRTNGIYDIPRMSIDQSRFGSKVSRGSLRPGDIIVFRTPRGYHSGIYVGNNSFVHSPNRRKTVRVETLAEGTYYDRYYMTARRVSR